MARRQSRGDDMTPAGLREWLVRIETLKTPDGTGDEGFPVAEWTPFVNVYMEKIDTTGTEQFQADQLIAKYDTRWVMPFIPSMDPDVIDVPKTKRLVYRERIYDITDAKLIGRNDGIELMTMASTQVHP